MEIFAAAEFWVGAGLVIFLGIVVFVAKVPQMVVGKLDARATEIQTQLDEAARIRAEAQAMLDALIVQRKQAEAQAKAMLKNAQAEAEAVKKDALERLDETIARRQKLAESKIANAEAQAAADVKAAAADFAAQIAEQVLAGRVAGIKTDPLVDRAIEQMAAKLQ